MEKFLAGGQPPSYRQAATGHEKDVFAITHSFDHRVIKNLPQTSNRLNDRH